MVRHCARATLLSRPIFAAVVVAVRGKAQRNIVGKKLCLLHGDYPHGTHFLPVHPGLPHHPHPDSLPTGGCVGEKCDPACTCNLWEGKENRSDIVMARARRWPKTSQGACMLRYAPARKGKVATTRRTTHQRQPTRRAMSLGCSLPRPTTRSQMQSVCL